MPDIRAETCAKALINGWITRFGVPANVTSDRGTQFTSALWQAIANILGTNLHTTTAYHPQANGMVERFHRSLKAALMARLTGNTWSDELPWVMLGLRTTPKEDLGCSAAELVYGQALTVPCQYIPQTTQQTAPSEELQRLRQRTRDVLPKPPVWHGPQPRPYIPQSLRSCTWVFIRRDGAKGPLQPPYDGPFQVVEKGDKTWRISVGTTEEDVSIDRLKPAATDGTPVPATVPRRGRPPLIPPRNTVPAPLVPAGRIAPRSHRAGNGNENSNALR